MNVRGNGKVIDTLDGMAASPGFSLLLWEVLLPSLTVLRPSPRTYEQIVISCTIIS